MIEPAALRMVLGVLTGWLDRRERDAIAYLIEENRLLRRQLGTRRLRLTDDDRRRLAVRAFRVGRAALREIATTETPDTLLRWHRRLIARKWKTLGKAAGERPPEIGAWSCGWRRRIRRGATPDPRRVRTWGSVGGDMAHPEGGGASARTAAADLLADLLEGALGQHRGGRFLHDRSLDLAGSGDVLHRLPH